MGTYMDMMQSIFAVSQTLYGSGYATGEAAASMAALGNALEKVMEGEASVDLSVVDAFVDWR